MQNFAISNFLHKFSNFRIFNLHPLRRKYQSVNIFSMKIIFDQPIKQNWPVISESKDRLIMSFCDYMFDLRKTLNMGSWSHLREDYEFSHFPFESSKQIVCQAGIKRDIIRACWMRRYLLWWFQSNRPRCLISKILSILQTLSFWWFSPFSKSKCSGLTATFGQLYQFEWSNELWPG